MFCLNNDVIQNLNFHNITHFPCRSRHSVQKCTHSSHTYWSALVLFSHNAFQVTFTMLQESVQGLRSSSNKISYSRMWKYDFINTMATTRHDSWNCSGIKSVMNFIISSIEPLAFTARGLVTYMDISLSLSSIQLSSLSFHLFCV
jgi:hypothetical protein